MKLRLTILLKSIFMTKVVGSFPVLDVFVKVAAHIARGGTLEVIGKNH